MNKTYEYSADNIYSSYMWTAGTPDAVKVLGNPVNSIGINKTAFYFRNHKVYRIQTSSVINATGRKSDKAIVTEKSDKYYGINTQGGLYQRYLSKLLNGTLAQIRVTNNFSEIFLDDFLDYAARHLPASLLNGVILDSTTLRFIKNLPVIRNLASLPGNEIFPDFSTIQELDEIYDCLSARSGHSAESIIFLSDMEMFDGTFKYSSAKAGQYFEYFRYFAEHSEENPHCASACSFISAKPDFCSSVVNSCFANQKPECFLQELVIIQKYVPENKLIAILRRFYARVSPLESISFQENDIILNEVIHMTKDLATAIKNSRQELTEENVMDLSKIILELQKTLIPYQSQKPKEQINNIKPMTLLEYAEYVIKNRITGKINTELMTPQQLFSFGEYCATRKMDQNTLLTYLQPGVEKNKHFVEYYMAVYWNHKGNNRMNVSQENQLPAVLFFHELISFSELKKCYGKNTNRKIDEMEETCIPVYYQKFNKIPFFMRIDLFLHRSFYFHRSTGVECYPDMTTEEIQSAVDIYQKRKNRKKE